MDINLYLDRINYQGELDQSAQTLRDLHVAHLLAVPFENLDIHLNRPIKLDLEALFDKIVVRNRGGFCYELNGLFAWLLRELGFNVQMLSAGVMGSDGQFGPDFDHMTLLVTLDQRWLADVGFGDSFREPLRIDHVGDQGHHRRLYQLYPKDSHIILLQQEPGSKWEAQYRFTLQPRQMADYAEMCLYQQTAPDSHFRQRRICTLATPDGRVTLSDMRLIRTVNGSRQEHIIADQAEYVAALKQYFGIVLD